MLCMLHAFLHSANANHQQGVERPLSLSRRERGIAGGGRTRSTTSYNYYYYSLRRSLFKMALVVSPEYGYVIATAVATGIQYRLQALGVAKIRYAAMTREYIE